MKSEQTLEEKIESLEIELRMQQQELQQKAMTLRRQLSPESIGYEFGQWLRSKIHRYRWLYWVVGGIAIMVAIRGLLFSDRPKGPLKQRRVSRNQQVIRYVSNPPWWLSMLTRAIQTIVLSYLRQRLIQFLKSRS